MTVFYDSVLNAAQKADDHRGAEIPGPEDGDDKLLIFAVVAQAAGGDVGLVAKLLGGAPDFLLSGLGNFSFSCFPSQDEDTVLTETPT